MLLKEFAVVLVRNPTVTQNIQYKEELQSFPLPDTSGAEQSPAPNPSA